MESADIAAAVEPVGLRLVRVIKLPPYHNGAIFGRLAMARSRTTAMPSNVQSDGRQGAGRSLLNSSSSQRA